LEPVSLMITALHTKNLQYYSKVQKCYIISVGQRKSSGTTAVFVITQKHTHKHTGTKIVVAFSGLKYKFGDPCPNTA